MIKLTEFTSVVDTYKKNFAIRSKRFSDKKKKDQAANKELREARIESKKFFSSVGAKAVEKIKPGGNILDTVIRFAGFTLLGVFVKNLDKIAAFAKNIIEKIKQFAARAKKFFDEVLVPLWEDIVELATDIKETFEDISDFVININPYNELSDTLDTVMMGILALGYRMVGLQKPKPTPPGGAPPAKASAVKTPVKTPAKQPIIKRVFKPTRFKVRAAERAKAAERRVLKQAQPQRVGVGAGKGAPGRGGMPFDDINKAINDVLEGKSKIKIDKQQYSKPIGPKQFIPDTPTQLLGKAIGSDIANLIKTYKKLGFSNSDLLKIANDIEGESFNERKAAYEILKKKGLADRVFNVPDASKAFPKPVNRTPEGILRGPGFRAPTIPPAQQPLTILQKLQVLSRKLQRTFDVNAKRLQTLTKGLDFRFDAGKVLKEQLLNPKNLLKNLRSFGIGVGIDVAARSLAKYISNILPYDEDFELLAYLGLIDPDRIAQLTATKIIKLPEDKRKKVLKKLERDSKSSNDIFGIGQRKRDMANAILKYINIFSLGKIGSEKPKVISPKIKPEIPTVVDSKSDQQIEPGMLIPGDYSSEELKQLEVIQRQFGSQSSVSKPSIVASVNRNMSDGLDGPTTYGSQGMIKSREVVIAIQPVEVSA